MVDQVTNISLPNGAEFVLSRSLDEIAAELLLCLDMQPQPIDWPKNLSWPPPYFPCETKFERIHPKKFCQEAVSKKTNTTYQVKVVIPVFENGIKVAECVSIIKNLSQPLEYSLMIGPGLSDLKESKWFFVAEKPEKMQINAIYIYFEEGSFKALKNNQEIILENSECIAICNKIKKSAAENESDTFFSIHEKKYLSPLIKEAAEKELTSIEKELCLSENFNNNNLSLYVLQHATNRDKQKSYLRPQYKSSKGTHHKSSRIKFAVFLGEVSNIKNRNFFDKDKFDVIVFKSGIYRTPLKKRTFEIYRKQDLWYYTRKEHSNNALIRAARETCEYVRFMHSFNYVIGDLKLENLGIKENGNEVEIFHLDKKSIIQRSAAAARSYCTRDYIRVIPKVVLGMVVGETVEPPSKCADTYALGVMLKEMAVNGGNLNWSLNCLGRALQKVTLITPDMLFLDDAISADLTIDEVIECLEAAEKAEYLIGDKQFAKFLKYYLNAPNAVEKRKNYEEDYFAKVHNERRARIECINTLLIFLEEKNKKQEDLFPIYLDAIYFLLRYLHINENEVLQKCLNTLFDPQAGPLIICVLVGVNNYLNAVRNIARSQTKKILAEMVLKILSKDSLTVENIVAEINVSISSFSNHQYSRKKIFSVVAETLQDDLGSMPIQKKMALIDFKIHFPALNSHHFIKIFSSNEVSDQIKRNVIQSAIYYMTSLDAGWWGKRQIYGLVKKLLSDNLKEEKLITNAIKVSLFGSSLAKENSRANVFKSYLQGRM